MKYRLLPLRDLTAALPILAASFLAGCGSGEPHELTPDTLTLYSIDGTWTPGEIPKKYEDNEKVQGFPVLGKLEVRDASLRRELMTALRNAISTDDGMVSGCFWPRHAVRTIEHGKTVDYVVCFQCDRVLIVSDDRNEALPMAKTPKVIFNKHLKAAGVPLVPE